jgi:DNA-binding NarL/FixJ family response regulator
MRGQQTGTRLRGQSCLVLTDTLIVFLRWRDHEVKQERVLLADKHQSMLASVRTLLETRFDKVFMVADENSLLEAAEKINPNLIIADLSLPVTREINIARRLKKLFPEIKLIILSVHDDSAAITECLEAGALGFVLKRSAVKDLVSAIGAVLHNKRYVSPLDRAKPKSNPAIKRNTYGKSH